MKNCSNCDKPDRRFYKNKLMNDGLQSQCTECHNIHTKRATERLRLRRPNYNTEWTRKRRLLNPGIHNKDQSTWQKKNRSYCNSIGAKYAASKLKRTPKWLTKDHIKLMEMYYQRAHYLTEVTGIKWAVDHIIPLQGLIVSGLHVPWNLRVIPKSENSSKGNRYW